MKQTIIGLTALVLGISGCQDNPAKSSSQTEIDNYATVRLPSECKDVVDVRFMTSYSRDDKDQVLCRNDKGNLVLYIKSTGNGHWTARQYVH